jgi:hypothetical protein
VVFNRKPSKFVGLRDRTVVTRAFLATIASKVAGYVTLAVQALQQVQPRQGGVVGTATAVDENLAPGVYTMTVSAEGDAIVGPI